MRPISSYAADAPPIMRDFLTYLSTIRGKSAQTTHEYYLDLRMFFRFLKRLRAIVPMDMPFEEIIVIDVDVSFLHAVTLSETYSFLDYIAHERPQRQNSPTTTYGLGPAALARKIATIRAFFRYLTEKAGAFELNPMEHLETPTLRRSLPRHLSVEDSVALLSSVGGAYVERDYCILAFFLNCGLRVSELVGINLADLRESDCSVRVLGKGNKERMLYLNTACMDAYLRYLPVRITPHEHDKNALFISKMGNRINVQTVKWLVKKHLERAGLDSHTYSVHKLRHTAATLMYQNGVDVRTLQTVLGHANLDTTMIYTHVSDENVRSAMENNPLADVCRKKSARDED